MYMSVKIVVTMLPVVAIHMVSNIAFDVVLDMAFDMVLHLVFDLTLHVLLNLTLHLVLELVLSLVAGSGPATLATVVATLSLGLASTFLDRSFLLEIVASGGAPRLTGTATIHTAASVHIAATTLAAASHRRSAASPTATSLRFQRTFQCQGRDQCKTHYQTRMP